jgi:hypothetical protein
VLRATWSKQFTIKEGLEHEVECAVVNYTPRMRRGGREAEGGGLLNRYTG